MPTNPIDFEGWIPSARGRLSFTRFGRSKFPFKSYDANHGNGTIRYIISYQKRQLSDEAIPFKNICKAYSIKSSTFFFVCVARCTDDPISSKNHIFGSLYIFTKSLVNKTYKGNWANAKTELEKFLKFVDRCAKDPVTWDLRNPHGSPTLRMLRDSLSSGCNFEAQFKINRNGILKITLVPARGSVNRIHVNTSNEQLIICRQFFYFLKDIGHRHQHHDPKHDRLIDLYPVRPSQRSFWQRSTLQAMYQQILQVKDEHREEACAEALGILSYARVFRGILERKGMQIPLDADDKTLEKSIKSVMALLTAKQHRNNQSRTIFVLIFGTFLAFLLTLLGLYNVVGKTDVVEIGQIDPMLPGAIGLLLQYFRWFIFGVVALFILLGSTLGIFNQRNIGILKDLKRLFLVFDKRVSASVFFLAGVISMGITAFIIFSILRF